MNERPKLLSRIVVLITIVICGQFSHQAGGAEELVSGKSGANTVIYIGIVPQRSATKLARAWTPILEYLSVKSGVTLKFRTAPSIQEFENRLSIGYYDIAYMNPHHYTELNDKKSYQAFAKQKDKVLKGIIVVRKDSEITSLSELDGKTLAFPSPRAFAACVLPSNYLKKNKIHFTPKYVTSHESVYRSIAAGLYPAGGGIIRSFNNMKPEVRNKLRILWTSEPYTPHAFAARPDLNEDIVLRIQKAMIQMGDDLEGARLLEKISFKGIEAATDSDWDDIRGLGIHLFE